MKRTVVNMLQNAVEKFDKLPYVLEKGEVGWVSKSYREVQQDAKYLASALLDLGFGKYDNFAMISEGRSSWIISEYALLLAGCSCVPLSVKLLPQEIVFRLNHSESKGLITSKNNIDKILPIYSKIERKDFKIIYLDNDIAFQKENFEKYNVPFENVLTYNILLDSGKKAFDKNKAKLDKISAEIEEDDVVTISYTSGTTGNPKGIMLTQLNYYSNSRDAMTYFNVDEKDRLFIILPLDHSFAHTVGLFASLVRGLSIYFVDSRGGGIATLKNIPINMKEINPQFMLTVPALSGNFMNKIIDGIGQKGGIAKLLFNMGMGAGERMFGNGHKQGNFLVKALNYIPYAIANKLVFSKVRTIFGTSLKYCVGGGALLDIHQQKFFYSLGIPIYQGYGLTEATPIISANTPAVHKLGTSGKVIPGVTCRIVKPDGTEAKVNEKGEIVIKGLNVMKGYFKNPSASAEVLRDGWLYTGDLGYYDEDGFLMVVGREKALLISHDGEKNSPEEIEEAIVNNSDFVSQIMLYNDHKKYTSAVIVLDKAHVENYIKHHKLKSYNDLLEAVKKSFYTFKHKHEYKGKFQDKWIPSTFYIITEPFTEQNNMINSTLKMVRHKITAVYKDSIDFMYTNQGMNLKNQKNIEQLKALFTL